MPEYLRLFVETYYDTKFISLGILNKDFNSKYSYYKRTLSTELFSNFLLNSISELLLNIYDNFNKKSIGKMGIEYIRIIFNNILTFEKKMAKFDMKKFLKRKYVETSDEDKTIDKNLDDNEFDDVYDNYQDEIALNKDSMVQDSNQDNTILQDNEIEPDDEDPFSINDMDVEVDDEDNLYNDIEERL
jgi:hypothetical protein